jgi:hypothetical protein
MSKLLRYIDTGLQYEDRKWNTRDPGDEADDGEDGEKEKNDSTGPVFSREHVNCGCKAKEDVKNALKEVKVSEVPAMVKLLKKRRGRIDIP